MELVNIDVFIAVSSNLTLNLKDIEVLLLREFSQSDSYRLEIEISENLNIEINEKIAKSDVIVILIDEDIGELNIDTIKEIEEDEEKLIYLFFTDRMIDIDEVSEAILKRVELKNQFSFSQYFKISTRNNLTEKLSSDLKRDLPKILNEKLNPIIKESYLKEIEIKNYYSIKDISINNLEDKREIYFVGENGDGKTVILQAIALSLKGDERVPIVGNYIKELINRDKLEVDRDKKLNLFAFDGKYRYNYSKNKKLQNLFAYGINRNKVREKDEEQSGYAGLFDTHLPENTTHLKDPEKVLLIKSPIIEELIRKLTKLLDGFEIKVKDDRVIFGEDFEFSKLSEGYKTTIIWICDLVARLMKNSPNIQKLADFKAIVLIDEVDLYLHPKWKYNFMYNIRKDFFPNIQFFLTTHSLVTILGASEDAIFYKIYKDNDKTKISSEISDISKFTSNILMTSPLFGLEKMEARGYKNFQELSSDDYVFHRIHKKVKDELKNKPFVTDEDVDKWIGEELDEELSKLND